MPSDEQAIEDAFERAADAVARCVVGPGLPGPGLPGPRRPGGAVPRLTATALTAAGGGFTVPADIAGRVRRVTGADVRDVRLHTGPQAHELAGLLGCRAVTHGRHVFFGPGQYRPGTPDGDALLAHELAHVVQQATNPAAPSLQCKFGFEFEVLIPVTSGDDYDHLLPPVAERHILGTHPGLGFTMKQDQQALMNEYIPVRVWRTVKFKQQPPPIPQAWPLDSMSIAELVTDPLDETLSGDEVRDRIKAVADWAVGLQERTHNQRITVAQAGLTPPAQAVNYIGAIVHPAEANRPATKQPISAAASVHQTYALPLRSVLAEFTFLLDQAKDRDYLWMEPMRYAASTNELSHTSTALAKTGNVGGPDAVENLRGFYALIRYYIAARLKTDVMNLRLAKNHAALLLFYKTRLSSVRNALAQQYAPIRAALDVPATRAAVQEALGAPRNGTFGEWIDQVLAGTGDSFFDAAKNEYSDELHAEDPSGRVGIVVENRRLREVQAPPGGPAGRYPPADWAGLATTLHTRLLKYRG